jgi:hypothetical protein
MLGIFTLLTILIATVVGVENWRVKSIHDNYVELYHLNREAIESRREGLSPSYYEEESRELDAEAVRLGIEK